jgi:hypothetical protein
VWWEVLGNACHLTHAGAIDNKAARLAAMLNKAEIRG